MRRRRKVKDEVGIIGFFLHVKSRRCSTSVGKVSMVVSVELPDDCGVGAIEEVKIEKRLKETMRGKVYSFVGYTSGRYL